MNHVWVIYGARQVGKTTLVKKYLETFTGKYFSGTGENSELQRLFQSMDIQQFKTYFESYDLLFIDEAQEIPQIGKAVKMLVDHLEGMKIILTGSSALHLNQQLGEPLVGRQTINKLYPISALELNLDFGWANVANDLNNRLVFGSYPRLFHLSGYADKVEYLMQLRDSYLLKDVLQYENLRNTDKIMDLLRLIAWQVGKEVSLDELGRQLGMSKNTVAHYLDILEKAFVIIKVKGFSRNLRKEVSKSSRYYFLDNGIRNAIINNFKMPTERNDIGDLWENFIFTERLKSLEYKRIYADRYFWRTYDQKEIDLVEEINGELSGYEFKFSPQKIKIPSDWKRAYPNAGYAQISRDNWHSFVV